MLVIKRTDSNNPEFRELVRELDLLLAHMNGNDHTFYAQFNTLNVLKHIIVAYEDDYPVGCGAIKAFSNEAMEVKRMFVPVRKRGQGIASAVLAALEVWAKELGYDKCVLETGKGLPEAIALYKKNGYVEIQNYGQYAGIENSVCFEKLL